MKHFADVHRFELRIEDLEARLLTGADGAPGANSWDYVNQVTGQTNSSMALALHTYTPAEDTCEMVLVTGAAIMAYELADHTPMTSADHGGFGRVFTIYCHSGAVTVVGTTNLWTSSTSGMSITGSVAGGSTFAIQVNAANDRRVNWILSIRRQVI